MGEYLASLGPAVANHLWQSTAFAAVAWGVALLLRRNQARVRYGVWLVASAKFLVPFALLISLGGMLPRPRRSVVAMPVYSAVDEVGTPFSEAMDQGTGIRDQGTEDREQGSGNSSKKKRAWYGTVCGVVWAAGFVTVLAVWSVRWRQVKGTLRRAEAEPTLAELGRGTRLGGEGQDCGGREAELLRRVERRMGGRARVRLVLSREMMEPGVFGVFRPVLIWPERLSGRLDDEHIEAILAHELMHVRRRDNLTAVLHMLVEAALWFHPAMWWVGARLVEERERACDEAVVEMGSRPGVYAESLLKAVRFCVESPLVCVAGVTGADLSRRVRSIMTLRLERLGWGRKLLLLLVALITVAVPVLLGQGKAAQRMMLAAVNVASRPVRAWAAAHAPIALEETPPTGLIAEMQVDGQAAPAQSDDALGPAFEVASIRPATPNDGGHWWGTRVDASGRFTASAAPLSSLVWIAYDLEPGKVRVSGGPKWAQYDTFDINAKVDDAYMVGWDKLTDAQRMNRVEPMIRRLLADRFQLKLRIEMQPTPVYALVQAKGGTKLKEVPAPGPADPMAALARQMGVNRGKPIPGQVMCSGTTCTGAAVRMSYAIGMITGNSHADRIVIDETGLKGYYNFTFTQPRSNTDESAMAAIEDDLGLKFEPRTVPMKTYVIDSAEKPGVDGAEATPAVLQSLQANAAPVSTWIPPVSEAGIATPEAAAVIPIKFDTVSFKACKEGFGSKKVDLPLDGDFIAYECQPVYQLLYFAFSGPHPFTLTGEPGWVDTDRYTFQAKVAPADVAAWQELDLSAKRVMVQALLEGLLKVKVHPDPTPHPVYDLVAAKGGPKFKAYQDGESNTLANGKVLVGRDSSWSPDGITTIQGITIQALAGTISSRVGRQVIDKTGLPPILYDVALFIPHDHYAASAADADESPIPRIFDSVKALGLELVPSKGPTYGLVVDHIERPPAN